MRHKIIIGRSATGPVGMDLDTLLRTRLLVQANSGGGKSWLLRLLAEQIFGKVPIIIIDPEDEFSSLREKFGFVLVGKGGETPADPRSAELVAQKLLELNASAVCNIADLKPAARHRWVRLFLEAIMDAPRKLWRPRVIMPDEAHLFCPEKGQGESEAFAAMQDLVTRGRKRGLCPMLFTQRLAKISKNVTAELLNRLVGMTFEDVDLDRAADLLSVPRREREPFCRQMKTMDPGSFFGLGRAISKDRILVKVGKVKTTHPELGSRAYAAGPPPAPSRIRALLPKLKDLPQEAEEKALSIVDLRKEIRSLKGQLVAVKQVAKRTTDQVARRTKPVEIPMISVKRLARIEKLIVRVKGTADAFEAMRDQLREANKELLASMGKITKLADQVPPRPLPLPDPPPFKAPKNEPCAMPKNEQNGLAPAKKKILRALADFAGIGRFEISKTWVAARAEQSIRSSTFQKHLLDLENLHFVERRPGGLVALSKEGRESMTDGSTPLSTAAMVSSCRRILTSSQAVLFDIIVKEHPGDISRAELATLAAVGLKSSTYGANLTALKSAGMIEYRPGAVVAADWIFVD
jgi:hypothetical protein